MPRGTVVSFDAATGKGVIRSSLDGAQVHVHAPGITTAHEGFRNLYPGDEVEFEVTLRHGKEVASNLRVVKRPTDVPGP